MVQNKIIDLTINLLDAIFFEFLSCYMLYLASNLIFCLKNYVKNAIFRKDFNLGMISSLFYAFPKC